ncbi:MAG: hypothetical protein AAF235_01200 [Planctomycetota bacterium]
MQGGSLGTKIIASVFLLVMLTGAAAVSPFIAASSGRNQLAYADTAEEGDPPQVAAGIAMGAFRGLFVNYLWMRANSLKQDGRFHESVELARAITKLQPRFPRVWAFHAWNLSYNISVGTQTAEERWRWVMAGVNLLKEEGIPANPNDMLLHKELAWIFLHKIGGYTDDSNRYYKRQVAARWTEILGEPPIPSIDESGRQQVIDLYIEWLEPVANAPGEYADLIALNPTVAELVERIEDDAEYELGSSLLREIEVLKQLETDVQGGLIRSRLGRRGKTLDALRVDPAYADAWDDLLNHLRKRVIIDEESMSPVAMLRFTRNHGPMDWRVPAAHGLYWAALGVERGLVETRDGETKGFDFVNTDRIVMQAVQDLWRYGTLYFNYVDHMMGSFAFYQNTPNEYFVQSYGDLAEGIEERGGVFESDQRVYRQYAAGYENFLMDAITFFYRRGQREQADRWYSELRTFENQNMHTQQFRIEDMSLPLDEFVVKNLYDRYRSPNVVVSEVSGSLQGAYEALLRGDQDRFAGQFTYAANAHRYYMGSFEDGQQTGEGQLRDVVAASGAGNTRMEVIDRDFPFVAGNLFARTIAQLPVDEAVVMYGYAPDDLRRYAYDDLVSIYVPAIEDERVVLDEPFEVLFPEPTNMAAHRAYIARKLQNRQNPIENINRQ